MSRIGKKPIPLPKGVTVTAGNGFVEVKGPRGSVRKPFHASLTLDVKDGQAIVGIKNDVNVEEANRHHGTARALIAGAVVGVTEGYRKNLKLEGTGYKAEMKGQVLNLSLGLSHPVNYEMPKAISVKIPPESKGTVIQLETFDKELLGQTVANLQSFRPPEPYKGKGVQVEGQTIRRKAGKAGGKGGK
jgi:large subunit ribosomal protein L6